MNQKEFSKCTQKGKNIQSTKLGVGIYAGQKVSEDYTLLHKTEEVINGVKVISWKSIEAATELKQGENFISLTDIKEMKTKRLVSISVPSAFDEIPVGKNKGFFSFRINGKGYSDVKLETLTEKQALALVEAEEIA